MSMKWLSLVVLVLLLQACGGGGDAVTDEPSSPQACSIPAQRQSLRDFMQEQYFWYRSMGSPDDSAATLDAYFRSLTYQPIDRYSFTQPAADYNRVFTEGRRVGYGYSLAWSDALRTELRVREVEPLGPMARAGLRRGDRVLSIDGYTPPDIAAGLLPAVNTVGVARTMVVRTPAGQTKQIQVVSEDFPLRPVIATNIFEVQRDGAPVKVGYLAYNQFVEYSREDLRAVLSGFVEAGMGELILDLRYNGGGSVPMAGALASMVAGPAFITKVFAALRYNDKQAASNTDFIFTPQAGTDGFPLRTGLKRVFVITSGDTASASELLINGLRPFVEVVLVGETTYGKPYGFVPREACGTIFQAVQFETFNARGEGGFTSGFQPTCAVPDDLEHALGDAQERRIRTALNYAATGRCSADAVPLRDALPRSAKPPAPVGEEWPRGMFK
jgi:carboxyl-terminal processing protease